MTIFQIFAGSTLLAILLFVINNNLNLKTIMATQAELAQQLRDITAQNEKARAEQLKRFADLEEALANAGQTTAEVDEAMVNLKSSIQADDDIVPDEPPVIPE